MTKKWALGSKNLTFQRSKEPYKSFREFGFNLKKDSEGNFPYTQVKKHIFVLLKDKNVIWKNKFFPEIQETSKITLNFRPFEGFS